MMRVKGNRTQFMQFALREDGSYGVPETLPSLVSVIGGGQIGGKARGIAFVLGEMEAGRTVPEHQELIRAPRSTILATELFDNFMEENGLDAAVCAGCESAERLREIRVRFLEARFPEKWLDPLRKLLEEHRMPLAVRSSSVMEDDPEHSFAGIYLSEFLPNTGSNQDRLERLVRSIKDVYASTFGPNARGYRKRHRLDWRQEKMAVLIQDMVGRRYGKDLFYPLVAGVSFSRNYYPWTPALTPEDGTVRLVVGTGTRAVGREYARVFSVARPSLRPEGTDTRTIIRNSQETVDVLDLTAGKLGQRRLNELDNPLLTRVCSIAFEDGSLRTPATMMRAHVASDRLVASFDRLISGSQLMPFTPLMKSLMTYLEDLMGMPVDVEFAVNFPQSSADRPAFHLLQVRPLGARHEHRSIDIPELPRDRILMDSRRVLGNGVRRGLNHILYVEPSLYRHDKGYEVARKIGRVNEMLEDEPYILIGPGRWASSNPQLGVPVQYGEIVGAAVIVEMSTESFSPELSYGTHFYADMVASEVLYLPFNESEGDWLNRALLAKLPAIRHGAFVTHITIEEGFDVFVDGDGRRGVIARSAS